MFLYCVARAHPSPSATSCGAIGIYEAGNREGNGWLGNIIEKVVASSKQMRTRTTVRRRARADSAVCEVEAAGGKDRSEAAPSAYQKVELPRPPTASNGVKRQLEIRTVFAYGVCGMSSRASAAFYAQRSSVARTVTCGFKCSQ